MRNREKLDFAIGMLKNNLRLPFPEFGPLTGKVYWTPLLCHMADTIGSWTKLPSRLAFKDMKLFLLVKRNSPLKPWLK